MIAPCHGGMFFEDVGHLVDGPVSQQILEGPYAYPQDLDPATRLLFEEPAHTYAALSPQEVLHLRYPRGLTAVLADCPQTHRIIIQLSAFWTLHCCIKLSEPVSPTCCKTLDLCKEWCCLSTIGERTHGVTRENNGECLCAQGLRYLIAQG